MLRFILFLTTINLLAATLTGQGITYSRTLNNLSFRTPQFWTPFSTVPPIMLGPGGATDNARFDLGQNFANTYTIDNVFGINNKLIVENDSVELLITGYETVSQGFQDDASFLVGRSSGDIGIVTLTGAPGNEFQAVRTVLGNAAGATGSVFVTGDGFEWSNSGSLFVGNFGSGNLIVLNEGTVSSFSGLIADRTGSTGNVTVTDSGSLWSVANNIEVGSGGLASLEIDDQGVVETANLFVATTPNSLGDLVIHGHGELDLFGRLDVGNVGMGTLEVSSGGRLEGFNATASIATFPGSSGSVVVTGEGSEFLARSLAVGGVTNPGPPATGGAGELTISNQADVWVTEDVVLFADGVINLNGGSFKADRVDFFFGAGEFNFNSGELHVQIFDGNLFQMGGTLSPGADDGEAGDTLITGEYHLDDFTSRLEIEIGGVAAGTEYDFVNVTQDVFLTGFLDLELLQGFEPMPNQTFTILNTNGNLTGFFQNVGDNERLDIDNGDGGSFLVRYGATSPNPNQIVLSDYQPPFILGDVNGDGEVNLLDVAPFVDALSSGTYIPAADINMDGEVNLLDVGPFVALISG